MATFSRQAHDVALAFLERLVEGCQVAFIVGQWTEITQFDLLYTLYDDGR